MLFRLKYNIAEGATSQFLSVRRQHRDSTAEAIIIINLDAVVLTCRLTYRLSCSIVGI